MNRIKKVLLTLCMIIVCNLLVALQPAMAEEKAPSTVGTCASGTVTLLTSLQSCSLPNAGRHTFVYITLNHFGAGGAATASITGTGTASTCRAAAITLSSANPQEAILCQPNLGSVTVTNTTPPNPGSTIASNIIVQWDPVAFSS